MKTDHLLFGAAYYSEYLPYDRVEKDMEMMEKADGFCLAWDTLLDSETADIHSNSLQGIYAKQTTAEEYIKAMTATRE